MFPTSLWEPGSWKEEGGPSSKLETAGHVVRPGSTHHKARAAYHRKETILNHTRTEER